MIRKFTYLLIMTGTISSCQFFQQKKQEQKADENNSFVARVYDKYLYKSDLKSLYSINNKYSKEDSIDIAKRYINSWIKSNVMLKIAEKNISSELSEIEKKVQKYRYDLIVYEYQKKYIESKLNVDVSENEIVEFYKNNKKNFELRHNIIKCNFVKIPIDAPNKENAYKFFMSSKPKDIEKLKSYLMQYSTNYTLDDTTWYSFNEIMAQTPFAAYPNQIKFLKTTKYAQDADAEFFYMIKILDYKINEDISPLEMVRSSIKEIIINKRRIELIKKLEEGVYEQARKNEDFEIYEK